MFEQSVRNGSSVLDLIFLRLNAEEKIAKDVTVTDNGTEDLTYDKHYDRQYSSPKDLVLIS